MSEQNQNETSAAQTLKEVRHRSKAKIFFIAAAIFLLALLAAIVPAYLSPSSYSKKIAKALALPAAFVNGRPIRLANYYDRLALASRLQVPKDQVLNQMILDKKAEIEASDRGLAISSADLTDAYNQQMELLGNPDLQKTGISPEQFKNDFVLSELTRTRLAVWLASQRSYNVDAYKKLESAQQALSSGTSFENAAQQFSSDTLSATAGGDLGFVGKSDVYPEIYSALSKINDSDVHVIYSRLGIHLVRELETDSNGPGGSTRYHIQQIFIKTQDFKSWLQNQKFSILKLV